MYPRGSISPSGKRKWKKYEGQKFGTLVVYMYPEPLIRSPANSLVQRAAKKFQTRFKGTLDPTLMALATKIWKKYEGQSSCLGV